MSTIGSPTNWLSDPGLLHSAVTWNIRVRNPSLPKVSGASRLFPGGLRVAPGGYRRRLRTANAADGCARSRCRYERGPRRRVRRSTSGGRLTFSELPWSQVPSTSDCRPVPTSASTSTPARPTLFPSGWSRPCPWRFPRGSSPLPLAAALALREACLRQVLAQRSGREAKRWSATRALACRRRRRAPPWRRLRTADRVCESWNTPNVGWGHACHVAHVRTSQHSVPSY